METLSHKFLQALADPRDRLYARALAGGASPAAAESALLEAARTVFGMAARDEYLDVPAAIEREFSASSAAAPVVPAAVGGAGFLSVTAGAAEGPMEALPAAPSMPADVWARLAAAVQLEAARSKNAGALSPDSQLLQPDPMLAPKKSRPRTNEAEFDTASPKRLFTLIAAALFLGILITLYIMTRPPAKAPAGAVHPPTSGTGSRLAP